MDERIKGLIATNDREVLLEIFVRIYGAGFTEGADVPPSPMQPAELAAIMPEVRQGHMADYEPQQRFDRASIHRQARPPLGWPEDPNL